MKGAKLVQLLVIMMLVLSFNVQPASAENQPPLGAGSVDEDGDLVVEVLQPFDAEREGGLPGELTFSGLLEESFSTDEVVGVDTVPVSPVAFAIVKDKTPTFIFSKDGGAGKYQIEVWNATTATMLYKFKGSGDCDATQCSFTPSTKLKTFGQGGTQGSYAWRVRSKTGISWSSFSSFAGFYVVSNGFNSTFDSHAKNWLATYGDWFRVDKGYLKSNGVLGEYASVMQQEWFEDQFVYEVTLKRKIENNSATYSNRIYFLGNPIGDMADGWDNGYEFLYYDDGYWSLQVRNDDAVTVIASGNSPYIDPYGWNKLTVLTDYPWLDFWINEEYIGFSYVGDDAVKYTTGYVGVAGYKGLENTSLMVDKAKLYYSSSFPYSAAISVDGERDPAYELTVDPNLTLPVE